jgi:hypothetical protein
MIFGGKASLMNVQLEEQETKVRIKYRRNVEKYSVRIACRYSALCWTADL